MSQIHSALAYYWDNKQELDADMERRFQYAEKLRLEAGESPLAKKTPRSRNNKVSIALYMDEHIPLAITVGLRLRDVDVLTV
ncbi:MAG: hypothetical protein U7123_00145 [Potamolinea sp.]